MSGESSRPVFTKSRLTKKRDRFHGAFRGGFSAGHFNTVGSSKGWKPDHDEEEDEYRRDVKKRKKKQLSSKILLDYMDEEDANDWGGPSSLKQKFKTNDDSSFEVKGVSNVQQLLDDTLKPNGKESIGKQLLRVLGWREQKEGHIIYLPTEEDEWFQSDQPKEPTHKYANKILKRIELKVNEQMKKKIPPPKLDLHGIGFDPFKNAPEFQRHREMRRKRAQLRALAATSQSGDYRRNVYRTSALENLTNEKEDGFYYQLSDIPKNDVTMQKVLRESKDSEMNVLAYETADDFIGTKTVSGFALQDDDDDVYDDNQLHEKHKHTSKDIQFNEDEYNTEIYQGSDSDVEPEDVQSHQGLNKSGIDTFEGALTTWTSDNITKTPTVTNDGVQVLEGFVMGSDSHRLTNHRWRGPDVPAGYTVQRHKHSNPESIESIKKLSRDMKNNMLSRRMESKHDEDDKHGIKRSLTPMAGHQFSGLSNTLKSRFTASTNSEVQNIPPEHATIDEDHRLSISRSWVNWQPSHLLCKRFNVPIPRVFQGTTPATQPSLAESKEETFFKEHILSKIESVQPRENLVMNSLHAPIESEIDFERPTMEYMKSIFDTTYESDMSISEEEDEHDSKDDKNIAISHRNSAFNHLSETNNLSNKIESDLVESDHISKDHSRYDKIETLGTFKSEDTSRYDCSSEKRQKGEFDKSYHSYSSSDNSDKSRQRKRKKKHRRKDDSKKYHKKKHRKR
jgi:G patch domain-containing protein 1